MATIENLLAACGYGSKVNRMVATAIREGKEGDIKKSIDKEPKLVNKRLSLMRVTPLHLASLHGHLNVLNLLLERGADPNARCLKSKTPLMLACKGGNVACVERLLECGANVVAFESWNGRTCLHYAAKGGHYDCVDRLLAAMRLGPVAESWGFSRLVNVRDSNIGATPLHLAARAGHVAVCGLLLDNGAIVSATTSTTDFSPEHGSTPLHFAARGNSVEVVRELLAWGADRTHKNMLGYTPYGIALKHGYVACARMLNPNVAEPLVWPSPCKLMSDLEPKVKTVLKDALAAANQEKQTYLSCHIQKEFSASASKHHCEESTQNDATQGEALGVKEICCICFERQCTIEVVDCRHQMCASCTLALCCNNKPHPTIPFSPPLACPFCRRIICGFVLARPKKVELNHNDM
eukprot:Gb_29663 [translate_table: standard]